MRKVIAAATVVATIGTLTACGGSGEEATNAAGDQKNRSAEWVQRACPEMRNLRAMRESNIERAKKALSEGEEVAYARKLIRLSRQAMSREVEDCQLELESRRRPETE